MLVIDGHIAGTWTATPVKDSVAVDIAAPVGIDGAGREAARQEAERYSRFLGKRLLR
jgi:hypothetical protein